jgi:DNA polymerase III subunit epsilon
MSRQIVLDTETTGLEPKLGHRVIEIGCVELIDRRLTGRHYHTYLNPERDIDEGAVAVHGLTQAFLADKPRFAEILEPFWAFIAGAELIIHNAPFDLSFLNAELARLDPDWGRLQDRCEVLDTLVMARTKHPGQKNNLDALCKRYSVDNSSRHFHGALLDAEILADVYLAMTGGQTALSWELPAEATSTESEPTERTLSWDRAQWPLKVIRASAQELALHQAKLAALDKASGGQCLFRKLAADTVTDSDALAGQSL